MIGVWLKAALYWVLRLLIAPPSTQRVIDPNEPCPTCGHATGTITFERVSDAKVSMLRDEAGMEYAQASARPMVAHRCTVCGFRWYEQPVSIARWPGL